MFETHKLNEQGFEEVAKLQSLMNMTVIEALELMPDGRNKSIFITKLEEAMFFGTKAVASKDGNFTEIVEY